MAFCSNCGTKLVDGIKFCPECGEKVFSEEEVRLMEPVNHSEEVSLIQENYISNKIEDNFQNVSSLKKEKRKKKIDKKFIKKIVLIGSGFIMLILLIVLIKPLINNNGAYTSISSSEKNEEYIDFSWNDIVLKNKVPEFGEKNGLVHYNSSSSFYVKFFAESSEYYEYVNNCKTMGYTIDLEEYESTFEAFNEEGYSLQVSYSSFSDDKLMSIHLEIPMQLNNFTWPSNELTNLLPNPNTNVGKLSIQTDHSYMVYLGNFSIDKYNDYIEQVISNGFVENMFRSEKSFSGSKILDKVEYSLLVSYEGFNIISLWIFKIDK